MTVTVLTVRSVLNGGRTDAGIPEISVLSVGTVRRKAVTTDFREGTATGTGTETEIGAVITDSKEETATEGSREKTVKTATEDSKEETVEETETTAT